MSGPVSRPQYAQGGTVRPSEGEDSGTKVSEPQNRSERSAKRAATIARRRSATGHPIGSRVLTNTPKSRRFHDRTGTVIGINLGEVGVSFTGGSAVDAWFLPAELTQVAAS